MFTSICVGLRAVAVLKSVGPGALVLGVGGSRLAHAVAPLEPLRPLAPIQPAPPGLHPQAMALAVLPLALERAPTATSHETYKEKFYVRIYIAAEKSFVRGYSLEGNILNSQQNGKLCCHEISYILQN